VVAALRLSEVPDRLFHVQTKTLTVFERLCVWLASHRLRETALLLIDDPSKDLTARQANSIGRLIRESLSPDRAVIVTSRDPEFGHAVGDQILRLGHERAIATPQRRPGRPGVLPMTT
jgi:alpha-D-ribose 1-methylphosphonate 5-triphosphate synthase subunit PhnL